MTASKISKRQKQFSRADASVLLEVVLALALFLAAATVVTAGINSSVQAVERLRLSTHASNLAISLISEMQMHARPIANVGPEPFAPPFEKWKYQVLISQAQDSPLEGDSLQNVEVIISHSEENVVRRLSQLFRTSEIALSATNATSQVTGDIGGEF